jgi:hypothetical protein
MNAVLDTFSSLSRDNLQQTADDLRDVGQPDLAERICASVTFAVAALTTETTASSIYQPDELSDRICISEQIITEVERQAKRPGGWNSPAWQECKIYAHM